MTISRLDSLAVVGAVVGALLLAVGCEGGQVSRVDSITPARPAALAGAPTLVDVALTSECWRSCQEAAGPILELDSGSPLPSWLRYELSPITFGYYIGNPGTGCSITCVPPVPADCPGWTYSAWPATQDALATCSGAQGIGGFSIRLVADSATTPTSVDLRLRIPDCGRELLAPFTLALVGSAMAPGMCAASTGAPCAADADCSAGPGCFDSWATCRAAGEATSWCGQGVRAGPDGSACGCVAGICSWH